MATKKTPAKGVQEQQSREAKLLAARRQSEQVAAALGKGWTAERVRRELIATAPPGASIPDWLRRPDREGKRHE